jgi:hypothetical protein
MANIPEFDTLDEAVEFWETHDTSDYWEDMEEVEFQVDLHRNLFHPNLIVLTHRPEHCPSSQQDFEDVVIEYVASSNEHLVIIRDVPALQCREDGKKYILEETLDKVEHLLELGQEEKVQPSQMLTVPVFSFKAAA